MLPKVAVGRHCCAQATNIDNYRPLVGDEVNDEIRALKPIVAGAAGDIPMQFPSGYEQNLVGSVEDCAERLLYHPDEAREFGRARREHVRQHFLLPHLIRNELRLIQQVLEQKQ